MSWLSRIFKAANPYAPMLALLLEMAAGAKRDKYARAILTRAAKKGVVITREAAELAVNTVADCIKSDLVG